MFDKLTSSLGKIFDKLTGSGHLSEATVNEALQEIRTALLEADVALPVVKEFAKLVQEKAIGEKLMKSIAPGQLVIKIVNDCLVEVLSTGSSELNLKCEPPAVIVMTGLQGSGKTTTSAKLANRLKAEGKRVLLASVDVNRPAAQEQLEILAKQIGVDFFPIPQGLRLTAIKLAQAALKHAQTTYDVFILDTAGRLHIDDELMSELKEIHKLTKPIETLLVIDALTGQDAANISKTFKDKVPLTGLILTRMDSDTRGGAALSAGYITQCPIKFLGSGERINDLEQFHADRIASRILGMGDVVSLVEKAAEVISEKESADMMKQLESGNFDLNAMADQLKSLKKMGGLSSVMKFIPGLNKMADKISGSGLADDKLDKNLAIISSMTKEERANPNVFNASRKKRVAAGSGTSVQDINKILKQFFDMEKALKRVNKAGGAEAMMSRMGGKGIQDLFG